MISYDHYRVFYHAAQTENYTIAANLLNLSQPAVSNSIKQIEDALNVALFERTGRNVSLTSEGRVLYTYVKRAIEAFSEGELHISKIKNMEDGVIRVGASDTISKFFIFNTIKEFREHFPKIRILIQHRSSPKTLELLKNGEIDIAFVNWHHTMNLHDFEKIRIATLPHCFACEKSYLPMISENPGMQELLALPVISLERGATTRMVLDNFFAEKGFSFAPHLEFGSYDLILQAISQNMGIGIIPKQIANGLHEIKINFELPETEIYLIIKNSFDLSVAAKKLVGRFHEQ